jgi:radical SAM superfamily enzyme YgiQ (UPF0313 family)
MSNLGFQTIYRLLNAHPSVVCERVFLPDPGGKKFFPPGSTLLFSLESQRPLRDFDVVAFSLSFENDYPHILDLLSLGNIDPLAANRKESDPLIMAGGIAVTMNPEPVADFFDLFLLGEAEEVLSEFLEILFAQRRAGWNKDACLYDLQRSTAGAYVPKCYEVAYGETGPIASLRPRDPAFPPSIQKRWIRNLDAVVTDQAVISPETEFGDMFLTEVSRGCGRGCRFCAAGYLYRPPRFRRPEQLEASIARGLKRTNRIGLLGTSVSDHPDLIRLCRFILERKGKVAIGSLRLDQLKREVVATLKEGGIETVSLAPEAGSQRLRDFLRKGIDDHQVQEMAVSLLEAGLLQIRTYFMIGLPTETDDDITDLIDLVERLAQMAVKDGPRTIRFRRITVSINQFIPKPATPLQWCPLEHIREFRRKIRRIEAALRKNAAVRIHVESPRANYLQALFSLGDRRVGLMLLAQHRQQESWSQIFKEAPLHPDFWVYRPKALDEILPWDFIDHGTGKSHLVKEYQSALAYGP